MKGRDVSTRMITDCWKRARRRRDMTHVFLSFLCRVLSVLFVIALAVTVGTDGKRVSKH